MFKVPNFLSKYLNSLDKEEREKEQDAYKAWHSNRFTQMWIQHFNNRRDALIVEDEKIQASTEFEFNLKMVTNRAERKFLRDLVHKLDYKV
jgi:hypothetical protein